MSSSPEIRGPRAPRRRQVEVDAARHDANLLREELREVRSELQRVRKDVRAVLRDWTRNPDSVPVGQRIESIREVLKSREGR